MIKGYRQVLQVTVAALALGVSGFAAAADQGIAGRLAGKSREQASQQNAERRESRPASRSESRPASRSESRPASRNESRPAPRAAESRPAPRAESRPAPVAQSRPETRAAPPAAGRSAPRAERPARTPSPAQAERRERAAAPSAGSEPSAPASAPATAASGGDRGIAGTLLQREYQTRDPREDRSGRDRDRDRNDRDRNDRDRNDRDWDRDNNSNRDRDDRRDAWRDRDRDYYSRRPVHVIQYLPSGYRDYAWNGSRYYYHNGYWYRPSGTSYISVSVPYGFFVTSLPGAYTSVWIGGSRYYYSDDIYYTYEPARRGYVVVRPPYEYDEEYVDAGLDQDLYIYPAQGQSEQQQADDRYECHRWAVQESGYDPIDDEYDAQLRDNYLRAMTACLTGRGYTVR